MHNEPLLVVDDLTVDHFASRATSRVLHGVSFKIEDGETVALVGESGSGKSVTSLALLGLLSKPQMTVTGGRALMRLRAGNVTSLTDASEAELRSIRGKEIAMVFQEPMTSLNPLMTVGDQIVESIRIHCDESVKSAQDRAADLLYEVGIPSPRSQLVNYPHELSGGMRQRVMIAMALSCEPRLLIADEPTTGLDVTIQAQIIDLIRRLQAQRGMAVLFISHDLGVVAELASKVCVMYTGRIVESGTVKEVIQSPTHPYTVGLMAAMPRMVRTLDLPPRVKAIPGVVPGLNDLPSGCTFNPRCAFCTLDPCGKIKPAPERCGETHFVACHRWKEVRA